MYKSLRAAPATLFCSILLGTAFARNLHSFPNSQAFTALPTFIPAYKATLSSSTDTHYELARENGITHIKSDKLRLQKRACAAIDVDCNNGFCCPIAYTCILPDQYTDADTQCQVKTVIGWQGPKRPAYPADPISSSKSTTSTSTTSSISRSSSTSTSMFFATTSTFANSPTATSTLSATISASATQAADNGPAISTGAIAGIVVGLVAAVVIILVLIGIIIHQRKRAAHTALSSVAGDGKDGDRELREFTSGSASASRPSTGVASINGGSHMQEKPPTGSPLASAPSFSPVLEMEARSLPSEVEARPPAVEMEARSSSRAEVMGDLPNNSKSKPVRAGEGIPGRTASWRPLYEMQG